VEHASDLKKEGGEQVVQVPQTEALEYLLLARPATLQYPIVLDLFTFWH
jgi:hypothetical protein